MIVVIDVKSRKILLFKFMLLNRNKSNIIGVKNI